MKSLNREHRNPNCRCPNPQIESWEHQNPQIEHREGELGWRTENWAKSPNREHRNPNLILRSRLQWGENEGRDCEVRKLREARSGLWERRGRDCGAARSGNGGESGEVGKWRWECLFDMELICLKIFGGSFTRLRFQLTCIIICFILFYIFIICIFYFRFLI